MRLFASDPINENLACIFRFIALSEEMKWAGK